MSFYYIIRKERYIKGDFIMFYYRNKLNLTYPDRSDEHMIHVKHLRDTNFDENYPYYDKSLWQKFKRSVDFS